MQSLITLEIWAIVIAGPCIVSWILGEMHGAARMRKLVEEMGGVHAETDILQPPVPVQALATAPPAKSAKTNDVQRPNSAFEDACAESSEAMPSIAEIRQEAESFRRSARVWDDAELLEEMRQSDTVTAQVLAHYNGSIRKLGRVRTPEPIAMAKVAPRRDATSNRSPAV